MCDLWHLPGRLPQTFLTCVVFVYRRMSVQDKTAHVQQPFRLPTQLFFFLAVFKNIRCSPIILTVFYTEVSPRALREVDRPSRNPENSRLTLPSYHYSLTPTCRPGQLWLVSLVGSSARSGSPNSNPLYLCASVRQFPAIFGSLAARCNSLLVSGRPGFILATGIASESEVRWTEECTSSFHLNPSSCRISCFFYVRAFLASINLCCASEFGLHWRKRIVVVVIDGLPREDTHSNKLAKRVVKFESKGKMVTV